jgi:hypothetical protein
MKALSLSLTHVHLWDLERAFILLSIVLPLLLIFTLMSVWVGYRAVKDPTHTLNLERCFVVQLTALMIANAHVGVGAAAYIGAQTLILKSAGMLTATSALFYLAAIFALAIVQASVKVPPEARKG